MSRIRRRLISTTHSTHLVRFVLSRSLPLPVSVSTLGEGRRGITTFFQTMVLSDLVSDGRPTPANPQLDGHSAIKRMLTGPERAPPLSVLLPTRLPLGQRTLTSQPEVEGQQLWCKKGDLPVLRVARFKSFL